MQNYFVLVHPVTGEIVYPRIFPTEESARVTAGHTGARTINIRDFMYVSRPA